MTKKPITKPTRDAAAPSAKPPCKCYALVNGGYDLYRYNAASDLYEGPTSATAAECRACNMSRAVQPGIPGARAAVRPRRKRG